MPELPEVETTINELRIKVLNRTFIDLWIGEKSLIKKPKPKAFRKEISGKRIKNIKRRGKLILFELSGEKILVIHQKLTGHLLVGKWRKKNNSWVPVGRNSLQDPANRFIRLVFRLDKGLMMAFSDLRKFASVELWERKLLEESGRLENIGPDPLEKSLTINEFQKIFKKRKGRVKHALMNQKIISGVGNIYSDEILFEAGIYPLRLVQSLEEKDLKKIYLTTKKILKKSIKAGGESISDYRRPDGSKGEFDKFRKIYRREGKKCFSCNGLISRKKIGSRSTYFCPNCQK